MQFSLRSILSVTTTVAILVAALSFKPVLAAFLVAFVPAVAVISYRKRFRHRYVGFGLLFIALIPPYLASYGPSFLLNSYVMMTRPPSTKTEIKEYNDWVKFQAIVFAPMTLNPMSKSKLSYWRYEYLSGWMELSDEIVAYLVGFEDDTQEQ